MKVSILLATSASFLVCGQIAVGQAISQGVLLNQQSTQNAGNARIQMPRSSQPGSTPSSSTAVHSSSYNPTMAPHYFEDAGRSKQPFLSEYAGYVTPGTQLIISTPETAATIYYTTDGWTPTEDSFRYVDPITIKGDMRVQAIAVEPGMLPSPIADATYIVKPQQPRIQETVSIDDSILRKGTPLRLVTGIDERSDSAQVGDTLLLKLDENVMAGDTVVAAKGSLGKATLTRVERAGSEGRPGVIGFKVESLEVHGINVPLNASFTLSAPDIAAQAAKISNPNAVHISGTLPKGEEAEIQPGMPLTAIVSADTPLH